MTGTSRALYSIGAVARMLSVAPATLRTWEDRYKLVVPERSPGGHRLYSRDQIDQLRFIKRGLESGLQPSDAHRLLSERLERGLTPDGEPAGARTERSVVLVADGDHFSALVTEFQLRRVGYEVVVTSLAEAEQTSRQLLPALAVVEVEGPDGAGLLARLRAQGVPGLIAVSGPDGRRRAHEAGADAILSKPLDARRLLATVAVLLRP